VTLCATAPKANVTIPPEVILSGFGEKTRFVLAATVFPGGGGGGDFEPYGPVPPPQAANARMIEALRIRVMRDMVVQPDPALG